MYGTLAGWRAYALARGDSAPTDATDADADAALTRGSDYVEIHYVNYFLPGYDDTLAAVEQAAYEAANFELATVGFFSQSFTPSQQKVLTEVKGVKWTAVESGLDGADAATPVSTRIDGLLKRYMGNRKGGVSLMAIGSDV